MEDISWERYGTVGTLEESSTGHDERSRKTYHITFQR